MENKNQPASPATIHKVKGNDIETVSFPGLSKREHFAGLAMQGLISNTEIAKSLIIKNQGKSIAGDLAVMAKECADQLLKQLES